LENPTREKKFFLWQKGELQMVGVVHEKKPHEKKTGFWKTKKDIQAPRPSETVGEALTKHSTHGKKAAKGHLTERRYNSHGAPWCCAGDERIVEGKQRAT